jgi:hypothetical protein
VVVETWSLFQLGQVQSHQGNPIYTLDLQDGFLSTKKNPNSIYVGLEPLKVPFLVDYSLPVTWRVLGRV